MTTNYVQHIAPSSTPQSEKMDPRQVPNNAGGFTFEVDDWARLDRWLILGAEGGTYYVGERKLTRDNAEVVERCLKADAARTVACITEISESGRAPKNDPAIFALAIAASHTSPAARQAALAALPRVCRIGTHLFTFAQAVNELRGWGRGLRRAVADWYSKRSTDALAFQLVKYQQRNGWSHRDLLRLSHGYRTTSPASEAMVRWAVTGKLDARTVKRKDGRVQEYPALDIENLPKVLVGFERLHHGPAESATVVAKLVTEYGLTWEMVPSQYLAHAEVWEALLAKMPLHAMVRNLARMTANDLLKPGADAARSVVEKLKDEKAIHRARLHPLAIVTALKIYSAGHGEKGKLNWTPVKTIVDALDDAFYLAFGAVAPIGKPVMLALDVSGSMHGARIAGSPLTAAEAVAVMAMVTARVEPDYDLVAFAAGASGYGGQWGGAPSRLVPLAITAKSSLPAAIEAMGKISMGGTDCALPMVHALEQKQNVDGFVCLTDNETWAGTIHPHQALKNYRQKMGRPAKLVVVATSATAFTIADPSDAGMMDVVGFDTAAPNVMADFIRGRAASTTQEDDAD